MKKLLLTIQLIFLYWRLIFLNKIKKNYLFSENDLLKLIIGKELLKYGVSMKDVFENPMVEGQNWFQYYTFDSEKEYKKWESFCMKVLRLRHPLYNEGYLHMNFGMLNLQWGLKHNY